jgi:hypothetical protein
MLPKAPKFGRIKPKYNPVPNAQEKAYREWVRSFGCLVCGSDAAIHHIISNGFIRISKNHWLIAPLCQNHHQGDKGYHGLGSHNKFVEMYDIDLYCKAQEFLIEYELR